jgi:hypothetical protein
MVIVEGAKHVMRRLPHRNAIVLPEDVHPILDVRGDWQDVMGRIHKSARRGFRAIDIYGYQYETSHDVRDLEPFYHDMYVPTMKNRHGALASLVSLHEAQQYFRHGMLFFVKREGPATEDLRLTIPLQEET